VVISDEKEESKQGTTDSHAEARECRVFGGIKNFVSAKT